MFASFVIILLADFKLNFELLQSFFFKPNSLKRFQIVGRSDLPFSILFQYVSFLAMSGDVIFE